MQHEDLLAYLANVVMISRIDGRVGAAEEGAIAWICRCTGAAEDELRQAVGRVERVEHKLVPVGRYSDRIRNLEDMLLVALADGELSLPEKTEILGFAKKLKVGQEALDTIVDETRALLQHLQEPARCPGCGAEVPRDARFCTQCGRSLATAAS